MIYSNCKQVFGPNRVRTSLQGLPIGSVICFGSTIGHDFCLDTVLVVATAQPWTSFEIADHDVGDAFKLCTAESITACGTDGHTNLTLYRGATFDRPVHGMYSFVPALPATDDGPRFRWAGLVEAVHLDTPPQQDTAHPVPETDRARC